MGFSAGGALAMRLAGVPGLRVQAVMSFFGVPDLRVWLNEHHGGPLLRLRHVPRPF